MKIIFLILITFLPLKAIANPSDVLPNTEVVPISSVEKVIVLQENPRVALVRVDNGGSTDIGSVMAPSRLYVTIYQQGEMFDVQVAYLVLSAVDKIKSYNYDSVKQIIRLVTTSKDDTLKTVTTKTSIFLSEAMNEVANAKDPEGDGYVVKSTIGVQTAQ